MRREVGAAIGAAAAVGAIAGAAVWFLRRRPSELLELPPARAPEAAPVVSDEPLARETRFSEELHDEERRRHEAAERLKADPLNGRIDSE